MAEEMKDTMGSGAAGGARRATSAAPEPAAATAPLGPISVGPLSESAR